MKLLPSKNVHFQRPKASTADDETHACLITSSHTIGDFILRVELKTIQQLRTPTANPWETAWVMWHYTDNTHFYYFTLKTNGWELGKGDPAYQGAQRFLSSGSTPTVTLGAFDEVSIIHKGMTIEVAVNGDQLVTFTDTERPYMTGKVGLYNEDSYVRFDNVYMTY